MKNAYKNLLVAVLITSSGEGTMVWGQTLGAVTLASFSEEEENKAGAATTEFLNSCVVSLNKNMHACSIIVKTSKSPALKAFANKMRDDDAILLRQARALAAKLDVDVPYSSELNDVLNSQSADNDHADADSEFISATTMDLEHTIDAFRTGAECDDRWVRAFAATNLSTIENQLIQIRSVASKPH
jgi:predicted outer membrane protein